MTKTKTNIHSWAYFSVLVLLAVSIPLSKFMMSISEFLLLSLWLWSGFSFEISNRFFKLGGVFKGSFAFIKYFFVLAYTNIVEKFSLFFKNKAAVAFSLIYLMHIIGVFYSTDLNYSLKELRIKVPLILFPVVFATMEKIDYKKFRILMLFYISAVLAGTLISLWFLLQKDFVDIREISPFISSIRFGLNVSFALFALLYFVLADKFFGNFLKILFIIIAVWFLGFIVILESVTAFIIILLFGLGFVLWRLLTAQRFINRVVLVVILVVVPGFVVFRISETVRKATSPPDIEFASLDKRTKQGNIYVHDTIGHGIEDGRYVGLFLCRSELREAWNQRSNKKINANGQGALIEEGLIRYLTSKDLRKDGEGVQSLSDWDVQMIENGCANVNYVKNPGFKTRILKIIKGYEVYTLTGNPSGSSVMQRIEYLKAAIAVIKDNWLTGVGTGDLENSLYKKYNEMGTQLQEEFRYHVHNQYFAIIISFGIFGFLIFLLALLYPPFITNSFRDFFFSVFFFIMIISMLSDDTLETQAGVTLFGFFYTFLMFGKKRENA